MSAKVLLILNSALLFLNYLYSLLKYLESCDFRAAPDMCFACSNLLIFNTNSVKLRVEKTTR